MSVNHMIANQEKVAAPPAGALFDRFGRRHTDLRVSVTDRCNLRCTYCMPEEVSFRPREELLTYEEIARVVSVATQQGIRTVRLTGGSTSTTKAGIATITCFPNSGTVSISGLTEVHLKLGYAVLSPGSITQCSW